MILKNNLKLSKRFFTFLDQSIYWETKFNLRKLETNLIELNQLERSKNVKINKFYNSALKTNSSLFFESWNTTKTDSKKLKNMLGKIIKKPMNCKYQNQKSFDSFYSYRSLYNNLLLQRDKAAQNDNVDSLLFSYLIILKDRVKNINKKTFSINRLTCLFFREQRYYFPLILKVSSDLVQVIQKQQHDSLMTHLTPQKNTFYTQQSIWKQSKKNISNLVPKTTFSVFALYVFEIQGRIFKLQKYGHVNEAQALQSCFLKSWNCIANFVFLICDCCIVSFLDAKNSSTMKFLLSSENGFLNDKTNTYFDLLEDRASLFVSTRFDFSLLGANNCLKKPNNVFSNLSEKQNDFVLKPVFTKPLVFSQLCFCLNMEQSENDKRVKSIKLLKINRVLSSINTNDLNKGSYLKQKQAKNQSKGVEKQKCSSFNSDKTKQKDVLLTQQIEKTIWKKVFKKQFLYTVMEPQWETLFHKKSFQFRPGRLFYDCLQAISTSFQTQPLFFYDIQNRISKNPSFLKNQGKKMPLSILTQNAHSNPSKNDLYAHINNQLMNLHKSSLLSTTSYFKLNHQKTSFAFEQIRFFLRKNQIKSSKGFCFLIRKIENGVLGANGNFLPVLACQLPNLKLDSFYIDKNLKEAKAKRNTIKNFKTRVSNQTNNLVRKNRFSNISFLKRSDYWCFHLLLFVRKLDRFEKLLSFSSFEQDVFTYFLKQKYKQAFCLPLSFIVFKQSIQKQLLNKQFNFFLLFNLEIIHSDNHFIFLHQNQFFLKEQIQFFTEWCRTMGLNDNLWISDTNSHLFFPFVHLKNKSKSPEISFHLNGFLILQHFSTLKPLATCSKTNQKNQNFKPFSFGSYLSLNQNKNKHAIENSSFFKTKKNNENSNKKTRFKKRNSIQTHRQSVTKNISFNTQMKTPLFLFFRRQSLRSIKQHLDTDFQSKMTILPAKSNVREHLLELKKIIKSSKTTTQEQIIERLAPVITAWCSCYQTVSNKKMFIYCDFITFKLIWRWACRRHPNKSKKWIKSKYFHTLNNKTWVFGIYQKSNGAFICLPSHKQTKLLKCVKISENDFPYDDHWKKWMKRCAFDTFMSRFKIKP